MRIARSLLLLVSTLVLTSCNTLRGGPPSPIAVKEAWTDERLKGVVQGLSGETANTPSNTGCKDARNLNTYILISYVDVNYLQYRQSLVYDKQHAQAISSSLQLMMTIAGGLTDSSGVKDNYLAGIALLTGGEAVYDKSYLFEKTAPALASQMDAGRKGRLVEMMAKLQNFDCSQYPGLVALSDVLDYYHQGTLPGAISATQKNAETKDAEAQGLMDALNMQRMKNTSPTN